MLQSSFSIVNQHFSPDSPIGKNIFTTKDYDYPSIFFQKLYLSYLQLEQTLRTKPFEEIAKKINIVTNKNDKNFEKILLGFVYAILLHYPKTDKLTDLHEKQKGKLLDSTYDLKLYSEKILNQLTQYFTLFRNQTWTLFNHISLQLLITSFSQIQPNHRCGFIAIFKYMQKFSVCQDDYFITIMKTLNFYDQKKWSTKYNLELMCELSEIINAWNKSNEIAMVYSQEELHKNFSKVKMREQMSLMRHYLFGKLVHWLYMAQKMANYLKGEWPSNLQRTCTEGLKMVKQLYRSSPEECLVFSGQFVRYAQFHTQDLELKEINARIVQSSQRAVSEQLIGHHFSLVPIALSFLIPYQIEREVTQMGHTLYEIPQENVAISRVEKYNVHMIMGWLWKDCLKQFSEENSKNYLIENTFQDLARWCLMSHTKNLELRSFIIEWIMYSAGHNEALSRSVKEAFFWDWLYYLKIAPQVQSSAIQVDFNVIFGTLTASIHILNYFAFCAPSLAETLLLFILGKGILIKTQHHTGMTSQGIFRVYINEVLKRANRQGILRVRQILYQSQLSDYIKTQLQIRIQEGENTGIETYSKQVKENRKTPPYDRHMASETIFSEPNAKPHRIIDQGLYPDEKNQYYGDKELEIPFDLQANMMADEQHSDEQDLIYTSHQLIPASPTIPEENQPHYQGPVDQNYHLTFALQQKVQTSPNMINQQPVHQLEQQLTENSPITTTSKGNANSTVPSKALPRTVNSSIESKPSTYQIKLQKEFLEEMGPSINLLIQSPTIQQFTDYMKGLIKVLKQYKKSSQEEQMIEKFLQETAKILYLIFNHQFESFNFSIDEAKQTKDSHFLAYFLLKSIHQNWKQALVVYNVFVYKKLVKYMCEAFPSAEFAFYYVFLDIFKKGTVHFKEMKSWLFPTEREKIVIPVLQKLLGNQFKLHIYENAQLLKIQ